MATVGSLYAGIGGFDLGFEQAGHKVLWANEWDKYACSTFRERMPHTTMIEGSVEDLNPYDLEPVDVLVGGFPCQPFSVAGYREGFSDPRGHHFMEIMRLTDVLQPSVLVLENVKNLYTHDAGKTFEIIVKSLEGRGYIVSSAILNTSVHGSLPQNRERVFIVASHSPFTFPDPVPLNTQVRDYLEDSVDKRYYYTDSFPHIKMLRESVTNHDTVYQWRRRYVRENKSGVCPTLTANMGTGGHNVPIIVDSVGIRKLTPLETLRLQGFPDSIQVVSDAQTYKQAGNAVSVPVVQRVAEKLTLDKHI